MAQTELRRRRAQRDVLLKMLERAREDGDDVRVDRIEKSGMETDQRIAELEAASTADEPPRRGRRG